MQKTAKITILYQNLDGHMQEILHGTTVALFMKVLSTSLNFAFSVVVARTLGAYGAGTFFLVLTLITITSVLSRLGLDNALLRFTAISADSGDWGAVRSLYRQGLGMAMAVSFLLTLILFWMAPWLAVQVFDDSALISPLRWMGLATIPHALLWLQAEMLKGLKRISLSMFIQSVGLPLFALIFIPILGNTFGVFGAIWAYGISTLITATIGFIFWNFCLASHSRRIKCFSTKKLLKSSLPLYIGSIMNLIINWTPTILLGMWADSAQVGIFSTAQRTSALTSFVLVAANSISAPKFATLHKRGDLEGLSRTAKHTTKLIILAATPILFIFIVCPSMIMSIFGNEFKDGWLLLVVMSLGQFINVITGPVGYLLMMSGNEKIHRNNQIFAAALNIILSYILINEFGAIGAAIALTITLTTINIISAYCTWKFLGILTFPLLSTKKKG